MRRSLCAAMASDEGSENVPDEDDPCASCGYEVVRYPPAFDTGSVGDKDVLSDGQGAIIPDKEEMKGSIQNSKKRNFCMRNSNSFFGKLFTQHVVHN